MRKIGKIQREIIIYVRFSPSTQRPTMAAAADAFATKTTRTNRTRYSKIVFSITFLLYIFLNFSFYYCGLYLISIHGEQYYAKLLS